MAITTDNCSTMKCAFQILGNNAIDEELEEIVDRSEDFEYDNEANLQEYNVGRNPCLSHLAHLATKDACESSALVQALISKAIAIHSFYALHKEQLVLLFEKTGGLKLKKPFEVRWNTIFDTFKRLSERIKNEPKVCNSLEVIFLSISLD